MSEKLENAVLWIRIELFFLNPDPKHWKHVV